VDTGADADLEVVSGAAALPIPAAPGSSLQDDPRSDFAVTILPHSFYIYKRR